jgi:hypothetical protein
VAGSTGPRAVAGPVPTALTVAPGGRTATSTISGRTPTRSTWVGATTGTGSDGATRWPTRPPPRPAPVGDGTR